MNKGINLKHGGSILWGKQSMKTSPELGFYRRFLSMKGRCETVTGSYYSYYGGRGIKNEWKSFDEFKKDMWVSFLKHIAVNGLTNTTLDRINSNGNYSKKNCRWATRKVQAMNTCQVKKIEYNNKINSIQGWSAETGVPATTIRRRLRTYGWTIEKTLSTPAPKIRGVGRGIVNLNKK